MDQELRFRHSEINAAARWLMEQGWKVCRITVREEEDEPFAAEMILTFGGDDEEAEVRGFADA